MLTRGVLDRDVLAWGVLALGALVAGVSMRVVLMCGSSAESGRLHHHRDSSKVYSVNMVKAPIATKRKRRSIMISHLRFVAIRPNERQERKRDDLF